MLNLPAFLDPNLEGLPSSLPFIHLSPPGNWQNLQFACPVVFLSNSNEIFLKLLLSQRLYSFINETKNPWKGTLNSLVTELLNSCLFSVGNSQSWRPTHFELCAEICALHDKWLKTVPDYFQKPPGTMLSLFPLQRLGQCLALNKLPQTVVGYSNKCFTGNSFNG